MKKPTLLCIQTRGFFILYRWVVNMSFENAAKGLIHYRNEFRKIAFEELGAIGVNSGAYRNLGTISPNDTIDSVYDKIIASAEEEVKEYLGENNIDINLKSKNPKGDLQKSLLRYTKRIEKVAGKFSTSSLKNVRFSDQEAEQLELEIIQSLVAIAGEGYKNNMENWLSNDPDARKYVGVIASLMKSKSGRGRAYIGAKLGNIFEQLIANQIMIKGNAFIKQIINQGDKKIGGPNKGFINPMTGSTIAFPTPITTTADEYLSFNTKEEKNGAFMTVKLTSNPFNIKFKSAVGEEFNPVTFSAGWGDKISTYVMWTNEYLTKGYTSEKRFVNKIVAASLSSIGVGGYIGERSALALISTGSKINIKSLDVILRDIKKSKQMTLQKIKIQKEADYRNNVISLVRHFSSDEQKQYILSKVVLNFNMYAGVKIE